LFAYKQPFGDIPGIAADRTTVEALELSSLTYAYIAPRSAWRRVGFNIVWSVLYEHRDYYHYTV